MSTKYTNLSDETSSTTVRGTAISGSYTNQGIEWGNEIIDAAKKNLFFLNFVRVQTLEQGNKDYIVNKRDQFLGDSGITWTTSEPTTSAISNTALDNLDGVQITPTVVLGRITVTNYGVRTNVFNIIDEAREELSYGLGDRVDKFIAIAMGDATAATSSAAGATELYGGNATSDSTLSAGDIITTDLVARAARYLKDINVWYWNGTTFTKVAQATAVKNPWNNSPDDPFVFFIAATQEEAFRRDSQFINAEQYGSNEVVMNGEIGKYLGIKIVVTPNVEQVASGASGPDGTTASTDMTRCLMTKAKKAFTFVWGQSPSVGIHPLPEFAQQTIVLESAYSGKVVHEDAIVFVDVADM